MKKPDSLILIAIWEFFTVFAAFIGIATIAIFAIPAVLGNWMNWEYNNGYWMATSLDWAEIRKTGVVFGLSVVIFLIVCFIVQAILAGIGLLKGKEWGRITAIVHSALSLCWFPVGTVAGVLAIMYLTRQDTKDYFIPPPKA